MCAKAPRAGSPLGRMTPLRRVTSVSAPPIRSKTASILGTAQVPGAYAKAGTTGDAAGVSLLSFFLLVLGYPIAADVGKPHEWGFVPSVGNLPPNGTTSASAAVQFV